VRPAGRTTEEGDLEVTLAHGKFIEQRPVIYQEINGERVAVEGAYKILKNEDGAFTYGFTVASYDKTKDLVIDPVIEFSTYLGGSSSDDIQAMALGPSGAVYVAGPTFSLDFPTAGVSPVQGANAGYAGAHHRSTSLF